MTMTKLEEISTILEYTRIAYIEAKAAMTEYELSPEANTFVTIEDAVGTIEDKLLAEANADCEGSYNCGADVYTRTFYVNGVAYVGTLSVEYNRHDKEFYYCENYEFTHKEII